MVSRSAAVFLGAVILAVSLLGGQSSAGLITDALSAWNDDNDKLTDYSWAVRPDPSGNPGVVVGLARVDRIQTDGHTEFDYTASKRVWLAFAFQVSGLVGSSDPYGITFSGWLKHSSPTVTTYQLPTLLGDATIPTSAMFVLLELNSSPTSGSHLSKLEDGKYASETGASVTGAFGEIGTLGFSWVGAFGISDPAKDFLYVNSTLGREVFALSLLAAGPGLNAADFKALFPIVDTYGIDETKYVFASMDFVTVFTNPGNPDEFKDSGVAVVNYVPEPTSMAALLGLGGMAVGGYVLRRRKQ